MFVGLEVRSPAISVGVIVGSVVRETISMGIVKVVEVMSLSSPPGHTENEFEHIFWIIPTYQQQPLSQ